MAMKRFCDRCGDENGENDLSKVTQVELSAPNQNGVQVDLCGQCYAEVAREMERKLPRIGDVPQHIGTIGKG